MLTDLSLSELRFACGLDNRPELMGDDVFALLTVDGSVNSRQHAGGTAPTQVLAAIKRARADL
jgi:argininosuccinate lyase